MNDDILTIESEGSTARSRSRKGLKSTVSTAVTTRMLKTEEVKADQGSTASANSNDRGDDSKPRYYYINEMMQRLGATPCLGWESARYYDNLNGLAPGTTSNDDVYEMCIPTCWPRHLLMMTFETELPLMPSNLKFYEWRISLWEAEGEQARISVDYFIPVPCKSSTIHIDVSTVLTDEAKARSGVVNGVIDLDHPFIFEVRMDLFGGDDGNLRPLMIGRSKLVLWDWERSRSSDSFERQLGTVGENGMEALETKAKTIQRDLEDLTNRLTLNAQLSTRVASHIAYQLGHEADRLMHELEETQHKLEELTHTHADTELPHLGRCHLRVDLSTADGEGGHEGSVWLDISHIFTRRTNADVPDSSHVQCMQIQPTDIYPISAPSAVHNAVNIYISLRDLNWRNTIDSTAAGINVVQGQTTVYAHLVGEDLLGAPWKSSRIGILGKWNPDGTAEPEWEKTVHITVPAMYHWSPAMHIVLSTITVEGEREGEGAAFALLPVMLRNQGLLRSRSLELPMFQHSAGESSAHGGARCGNIALDVVVVSADPAAATTDGLCDFASPEYHDADILRTLQETSLDALFENLDPMDVVRLEIPILNRMHALHYQYVLDPDDADPNEEASHQVELLLVQLLSRILLILLSDGLYNAKRLRYFATILRQHMQLEFLAHATVYLTSQYLELSPDRQDWAVPGETQVKALDLLLVRCFMLSLCVEAMSHKDQHQHLSGHELDPHKLSERDAVALTSQTITEEIHHVLSNIEGLYDCIGTIVPDLLLRVTRCTAMLFPAAFAVLTEAQTTRHLQMFIKAGKALAPNVRDEYGTGSKEMVDGFLLCFVHILETDKTFVTQTKQIIDDTMEFTSLLLNDEDQRRTPLTHIFLEHHTLSMTRTVRSDMKDQRTLGRHKAEREEAQMAACQHLIVSIEGVIFIDHCGNAMQRVLASCLLHLGSWLTTQHVTPLLTITCEALSWHVLLDQLKVYFGTEDLCAPALRKEKDFLRRIPRIMSQQLELVERVAAKFFAVDSLESDAYAESHMWRNLIECCSGMLALSVISIRASASVDLCQEIAQKMGGLLLRAVAWAVADISGNDHIFEYSTITYVSHIMIAALDVIIGCRLRFKELHLQRFAAWCQQNLQRGLIHLSVFEAMKHHGGELLGHCSLAVFGWAEPIVVITKTIRPATRRTSLLGHPLTLSKENHELVASDAHGFMQDFMAEIYSQHSRALSNERSGSLRWGKDGASASASYLAMHDQMRRMDELVGKYCEADRRHYSGTMLSCATLQQIVLSFRPIIEPWRLKDIVVLLQHEVFRLLELSKADHVQTPIDTQRELACCLQWAVIAEAWAIGLQTSFIGWDFTHMLHSCLAASRLMQTTGLWEEGRYVCELAHSICSRAGVLRSPVYAHDITALNEFKTLFNQSIDIFGDDRIFHVIYGLHVRNHPILGAETWLLLRLDPKAGHDKKGDIPEAAPVGSFVRFTSQVQDMFPEAELHFPSDAFPLSVAGQSVQIFPLFDMEYLEPEKIKELPKEGDTDSTQETTLAGDVAAMAHDSVDPHHKQASAGHVPQRLFTMVTLAGSSKADAPAHEDEHPVERGSVGMATFNIPQKEDVTPFIAHVKSELTHSQKTALQQLYLPDQWLSPLMFCNDVTVTENEIVDACDKVLKAQQRMVTKCTSTLAECSRRTRLYAMMLSPPMAASDGEVMFTSLQSTMMHVLENLLSPDLAVVVGHQHAKSILEDVFEKRLHEFTSKRTELLKPGSGVDRDKIDEVLPPNPRVDYGGDKQLARLLSEVLDPRRTEGGITRDMEKAIGQLREVARNDLERQQCLALETLLYGRRSRVHL